MKNNVVRDVSGENNTTEARSVVCNEVNISKSNLVKHKKTGIKRGKCKKRVRFSDTEPRKRASFYERFLRFCRFLWQCTRTTVGTGLRKFILFHPVFSQTFRYL